MSTETTLEEELLQEAFDQLLLASWDPNAASADVHRARASRLRQRAAWVREKLAGCTMSECCDCFTVRFLTGPIPSETAPGSPQGTGHSRAAHPKETP